MGKLISHPRDNNYPEKLLSEHLSNVSEGMKEKITESRLESQTIEKSELSNIARDIGLFHDIGKATTYFQNYIRNNNTNSSRKTHHGKISALLGMQYVLSNYDTFEREKRELLSFAVFNIIDNHHGDLDSYEGGNESLRRDKPLFEKQIDNILGNHYALLEQFFSKNDIDISFMENIDLEDLFLIIEESWLIPEDCFGKNTKDYIEFFFLMNYLFSLLIDYDKHDAARLNESYFEGNLQEDFIDIDNYLDYQRKTNPEKFSEEKEINEIRNKFLSEIRENENIKKENHFYTLTAPTGIGKTFGCLKFAQKLISQLDDKSGRLIYALPFTSIIDQNFDEFEKVFKFEKEENYTERPNRYLIKHHYLADKKIKNRTEDYSLKDYLDDKLFVESWQSQTIVTTFVQLFHSIIGYKNSFLKKFHNIVNSVIILDEVQNIDPEYYNLISKAFEVLGNRFNTYFLLMTATQPKIFQFDNSPVFELINTDKYMTHDHFNRVQVEVDLEEKEIDDVLEHLKTTFEGQNCLIVQNTKSSAKELYKMIDEQELFPEYKKYCLTTHLIPIHRKILIEEIKKKLENEEKIIVISTQLIEAGVDLSFKKVIRDIGPIDSDIQVAGRCNRSTEYDILGGKMDILNLGNATKVYKKTLIENSKKVLKNNCPMDSSDFIDISIEYFGAMNFEAESAHLLEGIKRLNYQTTRTNSEKPISKFKLIKQQPNHSIYLLYFKEEWKKMDLEDNIDIENPELLIEELKENYRKLEEDDSDKEQLLLEIKQIRRKLANFQISLRDYELYGDNHNYSEVIDTLNYGNIKYVTQSNLENYMYDKDMGFLSEPKDDISVTKTF